MDKVNKFFPVKVKSVDEARGIVEAVVSDNSIDRYGDVIQPTAYKSRLKDFMQHPVLLSSHNYDSLQNQIGTWEKVKISVS